MAEIPAFGHSERQFILSSLPPAEVEKKLALAVVLTLLAAFFVTARLHSTDQLAKVDGFVPAYAAALFVNDLITAVLLSAQFNILHSRALLAMASGYLFTGLIVVAWALTFPGAFAPGGLLGAGPQSAAWLYQIWHWGFPLFVLAYALLKGVDESKQEWKGSRGAALLSGIGVVAVVAALTLLVTRGEPLLPKLVVDGTHFSHFSVLAASSAAALCLIALIALWVHRHSVLDLWLTVVMCAYTIEIVLNLFPVPARYTVGWYTGRLYGLLASSLVLIVLLYEITKLYAQLLQALVAQRREREARLMTGDAVAATIAHELKQPLTSMTTNAYLGRRLLDRTEPDLDETRTILRDIEASGHRAAELIDGIRGLFRTTARNRSPLAVNQLVAEACNSMRTDLQRNQIVIETGLDASLPAVAGDPIQVRQVLINLLTNAIDAMSDTAAPRILTIKSETREGEVLVSVADTGSGITEEAAERMFDPLFTTKPKGMGMGLAICRAVIGAHGGRLWATANQPHGAVLQFALPAEAGDGKTK